MMDLLSHFRKVDKIFVSILIVLLIIASLFINCQKPLIQTATYDDLLDINGIGPILAERLIENIDQTPSFNIDELIEVDGIGPHRLKLLKSHYR